MMDLLEYWHCATCGNHERAQPEDEHDATRRCSCGDFARVMTTKQAAAIEQAHALRSWKPLQCGFCGTIQTIAVCPLPDIPFPAMKPMYRDEARTVVAGYLCLDDLACKDRAKSRGYHVDDDE